MNRDVVVLDELVKVEVLLRGEAVAPARLFLIRDGICHLLEEGDIRGIEGLRYLDEVRLTLRSIYSVCTLVRLRANHLHYATSIEH